MNKRLSMDEVLRVDGYGLIVTFSDGTTASYTVDELERLRPVRETVTKAQDIRELLDKSSD